MGFKKGTDKPDGSGRKKGSINKVTKDVKEAINNIFWERYEDLRNDLDAMSPATRWMTIEKLMKYAYPTLSSQKLDAQLISNEHKTFTIQYVNTIPIPPKANDKDDVIEI